MTERRMFACLCGVQNRLTISKHFRWTLRSDWFTLLEREVSFKPLTLQAFCTEKFTRFLEGTQKGNDLGGHCGEH